MPTNKQTNKINVYRGIKKLTPRECEILDLIGEGNTSAEIAESLYLSKKTVDRHRNSIRRKVGLNRNETLNIWIKNNVNKYVFVNTQNNEY